MRIVFLLLALLALAVAHPGQSGLSEDIVPETETPLPDIAPVDHDHELLIQEEAFQQASNKLDTLLKSSSENQCIRNAKKSIKSVLNEVKNAQKILNRMDNGARCAGKGQAAVRKAKESVQARQNGLKAAKSQLSKAQNAKITVSVTYATANNNCNVFTSSAPWQQARRNVAQKKKNLTRAQTQLADAQKYLTRMQNAAKLARCKCKARVTRQAQNAVTQARKLTGERKRSIIRESMLICLVRARSKRSAKLRNNAGQACKSRGLEAKYNSKLTLTQTKLVKMQFWCNKHRGRGSRVNDKCGGFRVTKTCGAGKIAFAMYKGTTWSRYATYQCPLGWKWATLAQYRAQRRGTNCSRYSYYGRCGHSGYYGSHYYFRFKDSRSNCYYQHAGSYMTSQSSTCTSSYFAGIVCVRP